VYLPPRYCSDVVKSRLNTIDFVIVRIYITIILFTLIEEIDKLRLIEIEIEIEIEIDI
jgi:hypothetical protein